MRAIRNLFGGVEIVETVHEGEPQLEARLEGLESLHHLKEAFKRDRIRDSVRAMLTRWVDESGRVLEAGCGTGRLTAPFHPPTWASREAIQPGAEVVVP